ncbi:GPI ethanolamine phosphate transferase 2 isoform X2 [Adelges cooleyi]|uniref:GPI ethanolamine phosphate transferase 2 isoform X2 n=1 Tax=Adelges cooleyi TaxID=133065 RepID=UPI00218084E9|nr:GPI ethanolamine phosphate transferase 2 isoform X2 [Adelges cooleyi]
MKATKEPVILLYLLSCTLFSNLLYLYGFFSFDHNDNVKSTLNDIPSTIQRGQNDSDYWRFDSQRLYHKSVNKVVLMIIDGIRYDFFTEPEFYEHMPFVTKRINRNQSCLYRTRVNAPTVTMPRIKALMTGTVPNFIDIVLNLGTAALKQDSIISQARGANKTLVFYGDETWLKLFPKSFIRSDGTTSFYISDYTEVDHNITRHLDHELRPTADWDIMILHYLGLDHIGHMAGPRSSLMPNKLLEMDNIIKRIIDKLEASTSELPSVLIVCGDHGMRDNGGHGGSSPGEVVVPLFLNIQNTNCGGKIEGEVLQIDFAPSLSAIMGLPIPSGNIGKIIKNVLGHLNVNEILYAYHYNAQQVYKNYVAKSGSLKTDFIKAYNKATMQYYNWLKEEATSHDHALQIIDLYDYALSGMRTYLVDSVGKFDLFLVISSITLIGQVWLKLLDFQCKHMNSIKIKYLALMLIIRWGACIWLQCESIVCEFTLVPNMLTVVIAAMFIINFSSFFQWNFFQISNFNVNFLYVLSGMLIHVFSSSSSSFIEEENQLLYHLWAGFSAIQIYSAFSKQSYLKMIKWFICMLLHRFCKDLNYASNQWSELYSLGDWFREPQNKIYLTALLTLGLICIFITCVDVHKVGLSNNQFDLLSVLSIILCFWTLCCIFVYRVETGEVFAPYGHHILALVFPLSSWSWAWYILAGCRLLSVIIQSKHYNQKWDNSVCSLIVLLLLRVALLLRPHNMLIPYVLVFTCKLLRLEKWSVLTITILHYWLSLIFFFYQGNSNSVGTIDIVPGFIGQTDYNLVVAAIHVYTHTFGLPLLVYFFLILDHKFSGLHKLCVLSVSQTLTYEIIILFFRNHLFIWSVFSPKLLYVVTFSLTTYFFSTIIIILMTLCGRNIYQDFKYNHLF